VCVRVSVCGQFQTQSFAPNDRPLAWISGKLVQFSLYLGDVRRSGSGNRQKLTITEENLAHRLYFGVYCILFFVCFFSLSLADEKSCSKAIGVTSSESFPVLSYF